MRQPGRWAPWEAGGSSRRQTALYSEVIRHVQAEEALGGEGGTCGLWVGPWVPGLAQRCPCRVAGHISGDDSRASVSV